METTTILLFVSILIIGILLTQLYNQKLKTTLVRRPREDHSQASQKKVNRTCPSCHVNISPETRKCPECKSYISICPACDKDSIFQTENKKGNRRLKVQSGISNLGWPISKIAVCSSCNTGFLLCGHCASPVATAADSCPNCDAKLAIGVVPIAKELGQVIAGIIRGKRTGASRKK